MHPRLKQKMSLRDFFLRYANITKLTQPLLKYICNKQTDEKKKQELEKLLKPENKELLTHYLHERQLKDLLEENKSAELHYKELIQKLPALIPRFYSISSSQKETKEEIHLTVVLVGFTSNNEQRIGVATNFLCNVAKENETKIPLFVHTNLAFHLPAPTDDIIMIGPGCGVAPFISFLHDRKQSKATGKNWLFFGDRKKAYDFYYEDFLTGLEKEGFLRLSLAFSRDQQEKIYVQHQILKQKKELVQWIDNGAYLYVCGDAKRMAKDIDAALERILIEEKNLSADQAKTFIEKMFKEKRYRKDVY
jgi:sulfite reductase (NADPH) flavoprotein alpha-component